MKYLRKFNESIDISEEDIKDILLEVEDLGAEIDYSSVKYPINTQHIIRVYFSKGINWADIKDCMLRLKDYLGYKFADFSYSEIRRDGIQSNYKSLKNLNEKTEIENLIVSVKMIYEV